MKRLFAFRSFAHDPKRVLAAVHRLAVVCVELLLDGRLRVAHVRVSRKLRVTAFADSEHWDVPYLFHDSQIALSHTESLAHSAGRA
jgi:hypothetical protein